MKQISVQPRWCLALPVQQQSVLLLGARGPDGIAKAHPAKRIQRAYRACVLVAARYGRSLHWGEKADTFMCLEEFSDSAKWTHAVEQFFLHADDLPHHFYMHLIHGAEILGYKHPDERFRMRWHDFYRQCVKEFHLAPESEPEMDARLSDWERKHWQLLPSVADGVGLFPLPSRETEKLRDAIEAGENHDPNNPDPPHAEHDCYCVRCCAIRFLDAALSKPAKKEEVAA